MAPVARQRREPTPLARLLRGCRGRPSWLLASSAPRHASSFMVRRQRMCDGFNLFACSSWSAASAPPVRSAGFLTHSPVLDEPPKVRLPNFTIRVVSHARSRATAWWSGRRRTEPC